MPKITPLNVLKFIFFFFISTGVYDEAGICTAIVCFSFYINQEFNHASNKINNQASKLQFDTMYKLFEFITLLGKRIDILNIKLKNKK